jgi:large subunit ribosomal protein L17
MNSKKKVTKLKGSAAHTKSLKRSLITDLILYEHVQTTARKAKAVAPMIDKVINIAKKYDKRMATKKLSNIFFNEKATEKVMDVLVKRLADDNGGYVQLYKVGNRKGDNAPMIKMILKGYAYKEIGTKSTKKKATKKTVEEKEQKGYEVEEIKDLSAQQSQVGVKGSKGKAKSRSGI